MEIFPIELGCFVEKGFINKSPQAKIYLGSKVHKDKLNNIQVKFVCNNDVDANTLLVWYEDTVGYGTTEFEVELPFFGVVATYIVVITTDLSIDINNEVIFNLQIVG